MSDVERNRGDLIRESVERLISAPGDEQRYLEVSFALDRAVEHHLRYEDLLRLLEQEVGRSAPRDAWAWMMAAGVGATLLGDAATALFWLDRCRDELEKAGRHETLAAAILHAERARALYHRGAHDLGLEAGSRALQLARSSRSELAEAHAHHYLGLLATRLQDYAYARAQLEAAREWFERNGRRLGRARVLDSLANLEMRLGRHEPAREMLHESLAVKEELADLRGVALTCGSLARLYTALAEYEPAMLFVERARELSARVGDERSATNMRIQAGHLYVRTDQPEAARRAYLSARALARQRGDMRLEGYACFHLADAERQLGEPAAALEAVIHACDYFASNDEPVMSDRCEIRRALLEGADPVSPQIAEPLARLRRSADAAPLAETLFEVGTYLRERDRTHDVAQLYAEALDTAEPHQAIQFAALIRSRAGSDEGRAWVDAMLTVKQHKDRLEQAYAELRRAEGLRDALTQMIVHDLKNPLTAITPVLETVQSVELTPEERNECIQTALDECRYLLRMIEDLNDVGKVQHQGRLELRLEAFDLALLLPDVARRLQNRASDSGLTLEVEPLPDLPAVTGDRNRLRRVLENLVINAIKYGRPPRGSGRPAVVRLSAWREDDSVRVEVRDFGEGIPIAEADRIFEAYYQAEAGRKRKAGVGLGLAFCRMVVKAHGGTIWTIPNPEGGSIFAFRLPLAPAER